MNNDFAFMMFASEQMGLTDTHEGRVNRAIKYLQQGYDMEQALAAAGLTTADLTDYDIDRLEAEV